MQGDLFDSENPLIQPSVQELWHTTCGWKGYLRDCEEVSSGKDPECPTSLFLCPNCKAEFIGMTLLGVGKSEDVFVERLDY